MQSLAIIKSEHRNLGAVLYTLEQLVEQIELGKVPQFGVFHGLLMYLDRFLDRYHHPKENQYLFPALRKRAPESEATLAELEQQHRDGEDLFVEVLKALSAFEFAGEPEFPAFRDAARRYIRFERDHAFREERDVMPLAAEKLLPEDWARIDAAFNDNQDPMFGRERSALFEKLHREIVSLVPAPVGLGAQWQNT
jgi:branched-chain amino acid transport system ATP-binding protein